MIGIQESLSVGKATGSGVFRQWGRVKTARDVGVVNEKLVTVTVHQVKIWVYFAGTAAAKNEAD